MWPIRCDANGGDIRVYGPDELEEARRKHPDAHVTIIDRYDSRVSLTPNLGIFHDPLLMRYGTDTFDTYAAVGWTGQTMPRAVWDMGVMFRGRVLLAVAMRGVSMGPGRFAKEYFPAKQDCFQISRADGVVVRLRSKHNETMAQVAAMRKDGFCAHDMVRRAAVHCVANHEKYWRKTSGPLENVAHLDVIPIELHDDASGTLAMPREQDMDTDDVFECLLFDSGPSRLAKKFEGNACLRGTTVRFRPLSSQWSWQFSHKSPSSPPV
jgi:hypothetical protein